MTDAVHNIRTTHQRQGGHTVNTTHHDRRVEHYKRRANHSWAIGFTIGLVAGMLLMWAWLAPTARAATPHAKHQTSGATDQYPLPKHWRVYVKVAQCEQPAIASRPANVARRYWMGVRWDHPGRGNGAGWPGGLGMMHVHWEQFKPKGAPRLQQNATPAQQLISADRAYRYFRRIYGVRGGTTFWVCGAQIGWRGIDDAGRVVWR